MRKGFAFFLSLVLIITSCFSIVSAVEIEPTTELISLRAYKDENYELEVRDEGFTAFEAGDTIRIVAVIKNAYGLDLNDRSYSTGMMFEKLADSDKLSRMLNTIMPTITDVSDTYLI